MRHLVLTSVLICGLVGALPAETDEAVARYTRQVELGRGHRLAGRHREASLALEEAVKILPGPSTAYALLGEVYLTWEDDRSDVILGRLETALAYLQKALTLETALVRTGGGDPGLLGRIRQAYYQARKKRAWWRRFVGAITEGNELLAAGKFAEAEEKLEAAREMWPDHWSVNNLLGSAEFSQGKHVEALEHFAVAFEKGQEIENVWENFIVAQAYAGDPQAALENVGIMRRRFAPSGKWRRVIARVHRARGDRLYKEGNRNGAIADYRQSLLYFGGDAYVLRSLGKVLTETEDLRGAQVYYERLVIMDPKDRLALAALVDLKRKQEDFDGALAAARQLGKVVPDHPLVWQWIEQLKSARDSN